MKPNELQINKGTPTFALPTNIDISDVSDDTPITVSIPTTTTSTVSVNQIKARMTVRSNDILQLQATIEQLTADNADDQATIDNITALAPSKFQAQEVSSNSVI